jgi:bifunctional DNA-binding transcriptional regulator/antitoxin component of YhaV-PrlF toxin-antitoxin module
MTVAVKNNNKTPLVVPLALRRKVGFKNGQDLEFSATGGVITLAPKLPITDDDYTPAERRAIDRGIAVSEKDYKEGRSYGPFKTHEEFIASLDREGAKLRANKRTRSAK